MSILFRSTKGRGLSLDCPICGQEARIEARSKRPRFYCTDGHKHAEVEAALSAESLAEIHAEVRRDRTERLAASQGVDEFVPVALGETGKPSTATPASTTPVVAEAKFGVSGRSDEPPRTCGLLDAVVGQIRAYVVLPSENEATALGLFVLHTYAVGAAHATPYLLVTSPERRAGKTRLLELLELLVARPWRVTAASESAMFRKIGAARPTLLLDEIDAIFGAASERTEPLRAVLNAGNRPGASVARCVSEDGEHRVVDFNVFCPKVLAGIDTGRVPDTITDRSIRLAMKRKTAGEEVERFRYRDARDECEPLCQAAETWAAAHETELHEARPELPAQLDDRAAEAWEPLLAIADLAAGLWPKRARDAALGLIGDDSDEPSLGSRLLGKIVEIFEHDGAEALGTIEILHHVNADDELPFGGFGHGAGLDGRGLARLLKPYKIRPRSVRRGAVTSKGYKREQFEEASERYGPRPPQPPQASHTSHEGSGVKLRVTDVPHVPDAAGEPTAMPSGHVSERPESALAPDDRSAEADDLSDLAGKELPLRDRAPKALAQKRCTGDRHKTQPIQDEDGDWRCFPCGLACDPPSGAL